jgi:hypothetical protein
LETTGSLSSATNSAGIVVWIAAAISAVPTRFVMIAVAFVKLMPTNSPRALLFVALNPWYALDRSIYVRLSSTLIRAS